MKTYKESTNFAAALLFRLGVVSFFPPSVQKTVPLRLKVKLFFYVWDLYARRNTTE